MPGSDRIGLQIPLWSLAIVAVLFFLRAASSLLIPLALAFLISCVLEPIVAWLERHRLPRGVAVVAVLVPLPNIR